MKCVAFFMAILQVRRMAQQPPVEIPGSATTPGYLQGSGDTPFILVLPTPSIGTLGHSPHAPA